MWLVPLRPNCSELNRTTIVVPVSPALLSPSGFALCLSWQRIDRQPCGSGDGRQRGAQHAEWGVGEEGKEGRVMVMINAKKD